MKAIKKERLPWYPPVNKEDRLPGKRRKFYSKFYHTTVWRKTTKAYAAEHPLCEECLRRGKTTPGQVTDHIIPINPVDPYDTQNGKYGDPLDWDNLQRLCIKCHNRKSGKEAHVNRDD